MQSLLLQGQHDMSGVCAGAVIVWTVPLRLRPLASGLGTVVPHLLGDVPILPIVGWVQGACTPILHALHFKSRR